MSRRITITISTALMIILIVLTAFGYERFWNVITFLYAISLVMFTTKIMAIREGSSKFHAELRPEAERFTKHKGFMYFSVYADYAFAATAAYYEHYFVATVIFTSGVLEFFAYTLYKKILDTTKPLEEE